MPSKFKHAVKCTFFVFLLSSCTTSSNFEQTAIPSPLRSPIFVNEQVSPIASVSNTETLEKKETLITVISSEQPSSKIIDTSNDTLKIPTFKMRQAVNINVESLPIPAFINELFGNVLGLSFQIEASLQNKKDLVTLRITESQEPEKLYMTAIQVLTDYGIVTELLPDNMIKFSVDNKKIESTPPLLISGKALPEVPVSHRPIFQSIPLKVMRANQVHSLLNSVLPDKELRIQINLLTSSLLLSGSLDRVKLAKSLIEFFDQPSVRTQHAIRVNPAFLSAEELATQLDEVLKTEGYYSGIGSNAINNSSSIILLPLASTNTLLIFTADDEVLKHVQKWVTALDIAVPSKQKVSVGLFFYPVKNTSADSLAKIFTPLLSNIQEEEKTKEGQKPRNTNQATTTNKLENNLVVDSLNNTLIFQGQPYVWGRLVPLLRQLDKPSRQVLIEVVVVEITLTDEERTGIEWLISGLNIGSLAGSLETLGGLDINARGLNYNFVNSLGQTKAILNAFASSSRVNILSSPRVMVKSGETASINIGSEVPVVTSQSSDSTTQVNGNSAVLQQIQYRRTGVNLEVKPIIYAGNRVDIEISQEVSQAEETTSSSISSPTILNRSINTSLSLSDGGSVLLGGLMTNTLNEGWTGVPVLSEIPLLGNLFKVERHSNNRTELMILIVPYVLGTDEEVQEITNLFRAQLNM